ncbi:MAG: sigma-70 family RNA polymerase sigma factor [Candidatus Dormiibacterota bacterium]
MDVLNEEVVNISGSRSDLGSEVPLRFEEVYEQFAPQVHRFCLVLLRDPSAADDVAAQALARAFAAFERTQPAAEHVRLWLLRIARNAAIDYLRERSRVRRLLRSLALNQKPDADPETVAITHMEVVRLLAVLPQLRSRERELIALRCGAQLSYREISELTGLSENSATAATHRAMRRLKDRLEDQK